MKQKWKQVYKQYKIKTEAEERKQGNQNTLEGIVNKEQEVNLYKVTYVATEGDKIKIPFMHEEINLPDEKRGRILKSLINKLQTASDKKTQYEKHVLVQAFEVAKQLESCIDKWCGGDDSKRQDKAQTLL